MGTIPLWLQNITFSLLGEGITETHHKNQVARGLRFQGPAHSKPSTREGHIVYKAFSGIAVFIGENDSLFFDDLGSF